MRTICAIFLLSFGLLDVRCGVPRSAVFPEAREDCSSRRGIVSGVGVSLRLSAPAGSAAETVLGLYDVTPPALNDVIVPGAGIS